MGTTEFMILSLALGLCATALATIITALLCGSLGTIVMVNRFGWHYEKAFNRCATAGATIALSAITGATAILTHSGAMPDTWMETFTCVAIVVTLIAGLWLSVSGIAFGVYVFLRGGFRRDK